MRHKKIRLSNFSKAVTSESFSLRPDTEQQLIDYMATQKQPLALARGAGLSYSDSCLNKEGNIVDTSRLNHLLSFDEHSGIAVCQAGVSFSDLFLLHPEFIPPVVPGTLNATLAGAVAHDVHGKNNPHEGSFGHHLSWFDLLIGGEVLHCSRETNQSLFHATIGGLGLTGIITRVAVRLKKASRFVQVHNKRVNSIEELVDYMSTEGLNSDYQVAWIDLLNDSPRALLSLANHCAPLSNPKEPLYSVPSVPFSLIKKWNITLFNKLYFNIKKPQECLVIERFNNPLDKIKHWNRLYGPKGLIQFQAVFDQANTTDTIERLLQIIKTQNATPTLAVLKLFTQPGEGLLSFCKPGFTLAIDFIHNNNAREAVRVMNQFISDINGRIYLAKDLLLNRDQYQNMYQNNMEFFTTLNKHQCTMQSDLSKRLGITQ